MILEMTAQERAAENRKWMLAVTAIGIILYAFWTAFLMFVALMAESGGKNSEPLLATALLWPLGELIWTWIWVARHGQQYLSSKKRGLGNLLLVVAWIAPPPLMLWFGKIIPRSWGDFPIVVPIFVVPIACCWAARLVWSRAQAAETQASSG